MRSNCRHRCARLAVLAVIGGLLGGLAVMLLWNWLTPTLFAWKEINYFQALGILVLSHILFGGLHGRCRHGHGRSSFADRLEQLPPEEREKVIAGLKSKWYRCGATCGSEQKPQDAAENAS